MSSAPGGDAFRLQLMVHVVNVLLYHMLGGKGTHLSDHHQFVLFHFITLRSDHRNYSTVGGGKLLHNAFNLLFSLRFVSMPLLMYQRK